MLDMDMDMNIQLDRDAHAFQVQRATCQANNKVYVLHSRFISAKDKVPLLL